MRMSGWLPLILQSYNPSHSKTGGTHPTPVTSTTKFITMNCIQAILTIDTDNLPSDFQEIIKHEQEVVAQWKAEGILEHLFLRHERNGAVLIFKDMDEERARELMTTLPLYKLMKSVEYFNLMKQF